MSKRTEFLRVGRSKAILGLRGTGASLRVGLAAALLMAATGCGMHTQVTPGLASARHSGLRAMGAGWSDPVNLIDLTSEDIEYDRPEANHPFAEPINCYTQSKPSADGPARVLELVARNSDKPRRGFGILGVDEDAGSLVTSDDGKNLAKHFKLSFQWANNTATALKDTSLSAMVVFIVEQRITDKVVARKALGYAWTNNLDVGQILPAVKPTKQPPMRLNFQGEDIPLRVITLEKGNGLGEPCSEKAFRDMQLKTESIDHFVADYNAAYPNKWDGIETKMDPSQNLQVAPPAAAPAAPDTPNVDLQGIVGVAFGAQVPSGTCSHAVLGNVTMSVNPD